MKTNGWKYEEAYNFVKKQRSIICPNTGFVDKLFELEVMLGISSMNDMQELQERKKKAKAFTWEF
jgi:protein-tyrosine phosphatase